MNIKIACIIVTYNRISLLKKCTEAIRNQTRKPDEIIVINNSSTDGTEEWLEKQNDITVIKQENTGSAGGRYSGMKYAYQKGYDWIWSVDDDTIPKEDALEMLITSEEFVFQKTGFLASLVQDQNNDVSFINIPYLPTEKKIAESFLNYGFFEILSASFSSTIFNRKAIEMVGFPNPNFFIWGDDVDYTFRIIDHGFLGFLIRNSIAHHNQSSNNLNPIMELELKSFKFKKAIINITNNLLYRNKLLKRNLFLGLYTAHKFLFFVIVKKVKLNIFYFIKTLIYFYFGMFEYFKNNILSYDNNAKKIFN